MQTLTQLNTEFWPTFTITVLRTSRRSSIINNNNHNEYRGAQLQYYRRTMTQSRREVKKGHHLQGLKIIVAQEERMAR